MDVRIKRKNHVYDIIECDLGIATELAEYFCFTVPNHKHMPSFRSGRWDGKFRLFDKQTRTLYCGLRSQVVQFCKDRNYTFESFDQPQLIDIDQIEHIIKTKINLDQKFSIRPYQLKAIHHALNQKRSTLVSPTASGKSFIIYALIRLLNKKSLVIVPTIHLVGQMTSDFEQYGYDKPISQIHANSKLDSNCRIVVSTWQSLYKKPRSFFEQFDLIVGDEAHTFAAKSLTSMMERTVDTEYKISLTGTLPDEQEDAKVHRMVVEGLFGPAFEVEKTRTLIDQNYLADLLIRTIVLKYNKQDVKQFRQLLDQKRSTTDAKGLYQTEIKYILEHQSRNKLIVQLACNMQGNVVIIFRRIEHGQLLFEMLSKKTNKPLFYIDKDVSADDRNLIRAEIEKLDNAILVASSGTSSVGTNIVNLTHLINAHPIKSKTTVKQIIGRLLRRSESKQKSYFYDIADDISNGSKTNQNLTLHHFIKRLKIYVEEKHRIKHHTHNL